MKTTHTHRGTCQACGNVQAVDNKSSLLAKHGYTVEYGAFKFVCNAAGYKPAEHEVIYTHTTISRCLVGADWNDVQAAQLRVGTVIPETFDRWNKNRTVVKFHRNGSQYETKGAYDTLPIAEATPEELRARVQGQILHHEQQASGLRAHVAFLRKNVLTRLGQPLYPNEVLNRAKYHVGFQFEHNGHSHKLTRPAYSTYGDKHIGWYVLRVGAEQTRELRWTTRSLNEATTPKKVEVGASAYPTKAARKLALDKLNRKYDKLKNEIRNVFTRMPREAWTEAHNTAYFAIPHDLCHWRAKHAESVVAQFPETKVTVDAINALAKERETVKAAP